MASGYFPALDIRQPPSPLSEIGGLVSLKSMINAQALQKQETENARLAGVGQNIENQRSQMLLNDQQKLTKIYADSEGDIGQVFSKAQKAGVSFQTLMPLQTAILDQKKKLSDLDTSQLQQQQTKNNQLVGLLQPVLDADPAKRPALWSTQVQKAVSSGLLDAQTAQQYAQYPGDDKALFTLNTLKTGSQLFDEEMKRQAAAAIQPGESAKSLQDQLSAASQLMSSSTNPAQWAARRKMVENSGIPPSIMSMIPEEFTPEGLRSVQMMGVTPAQALTVPVEKLSMNAWLAAHPGKTPADYTAYEKMMPINYRYNLPLTGGAGGGTAGPGGQTVTPGPNASNIPAFSRLQKPQQDAVDQAAQRYAQTGQLPPGNRGVNAYSMLIQERAAELYSGQSIAKNTAEYDANKASYDNVTKTLDTLQAFEAAGGKNLDQFMDLAKNIPDTGIPWLNRPVRELDEKAVGAANMPAINAARTVALREIARVTNDPKLSGQLSDSAREEVEGLSPKDATFSQIRSVVQVLRNDMKNVETSLSNQKNFINQRLNLQPNGSSGGGGGPTKFSVTDPRGTTHYFKSQADADNFRKLAGIQ